VILLSDGVKIRLPTKKRRIYEILDYENVKKIWRILSHATDGLTHSEIAEVENKYSQKNVFKRVFFLTTF
jgi:hypothetical protein